jgi:hypothetical protein
MQSTQELNAIQRNLDGWELEHLREHAAALSCLLDGANAEIERLRAELQAAESYAYAADARADMFMDMNNELMDVSQVRVGMTKQGQMGVLPC